MEDDYSTDVRMLMNTPPTNQQDATVYTSIPIQKELPMQQQSSQVQPVVYKSNNIFDKLNMNNNGKEYLLTIVIIASLFVLFSSKTFRGLLEKVPFLNMINGEYNLISMAIIGVLFSIIYLIARVYIII